MTTIVNAFGKPQCTISGNEEIIALNTPHGCIAVEDPPNPNMYYQGGWVDMPPQPSQFHAFSYVTKEWVDARSLDEIKAQKWEEIKLQRDAIEFGGFTFEGNVYDSDQVSQGRIMGAVITGVDQVWTTADNTTVNLNALQMQQLYVALQAHIADAHERGRIARNAIEEASTKDEIESILL